MDYLTIREDIHVSGTVNENINIWDRRPVDTSWGVGSWLGLGLGVLAIASLFIKEKPKPAPIIYRPHQPDDSSKIDQEFNLLLKALREAENALKRGENSNEVLENLEPVIDYAFEHARSFGD